MINTPAHDEFTFIQGMEVMTQEIQHKCKKTFRLCRKQTTKQLLLRKTSIDDNNSIIHKITVNYD